MANFTPRYQAARNIYIIYRRCQRVYTTPSSNQISLIPWYNDHLPQKQWKHQTLWKLPSWSNQLMVNWWFGTRWFGILGIPLSNNPFHKGILVLNSPKRKQTSTRFFLATGTSHFWSIKGSELRLKLWRRSCKESWKTSGWWPSTCVYKSFASRLFVDSKNVYIYFTYLYTFIF